MSARKTLLFVALVACIAPMNESATAQPPERTVSPAPSSTAAGVPSPIVTPIASATPIVAPIVSAVLTPSPATAPSSRTPLPGYGSSGLVDQVLIGVWECQTFGGTTLSHVYSRGDDVSSLLVETQFVLAHGQTATSHETYQHHATSHTWTAILENGMIVAAAADGASGSWTFAGQSTEDGKAAKFRMIYTLLGRDAFRRDFQKPERGIWATYAGETCRRSP